MQNLSLRKIQPKTLQSKNKKYNKWLNQWKKQNKNTKH